MIALLKKEYLLVVRTEGVWVSMLAYLAASIVLFSFSLLQLDLTLADREQLMAIGLWLVVVFAAVLCLQANLQIEDKSGMERRLLLSRYSSGELLLAKVIAFSTVLLVLEVFASAVFALLFSFSLFELLVPLFVLLLLGALGLSSIGFIAGRLAQVSKHREVVFPLLLFPLLVPFVAALTNLTAMLFVEGLLDYSSIWFSIVACFIAISLSVSIGLSDYLDR